MKSVWIALLIALIAAPAPVSSGDPGDYRCRVSWSFGARDGGRDKSYTGTGPTEAAAVGHARSLCVRDNAIRQAAVCATSPNFANCTIEAEPVVPTTPEPTPVWCVLPRDAADAQRIRQLPLQGTAFADVRENGYPRIHLMNGEMPTRVYCLVTDMDGQAWCQDTPENPDGCEYWAWTKHPSPGWYPRAEWVGDHWVIQVGFYNQKDNRGRDFHIFAE